MTKNDKIIALFDFCGTLIHGQSASMFLLFLQNNEKSLAKKLYIKSRNKLSHIFQMNNLEHLNYLLKNYKGKSFNEFSNLSKRFVREVLVKDENKKVVGLLLWHKKNGHDVVIVSNGFGIYLREYAGIYKTDYVVSTELKFNQNIFNGEIDGEECFGENKVRFIRKNIDLGNYDLKKSFAYSDSESDIPLLSLVGNAFIVRNNQDIGWIKNGWKIID